MVRRPSVTAYPDFHSASVFLLFTILYDLGKTLEQLDSRYPLSPSPSSLSLDQLVYFQHIAKQDRPTVWHLQCTTLGRSEGSPAGTQMAVACPNAHFALGRQRIRALYTILALFCKI